MITPCPLPPHALLARHRAGGGYTDCYATTLERAVSLAELIDAFYTTPLFKLERLVLAWFAQRPSTDLQARELAFGQRDTFAAWRVQARAPDQVLLADVTGRTCSWLMVAAAAEGSAATATRLYFGSAVLPRGEAEAAASGGHRLGVTFHALLGFHKLYSRALLSSARRRLAARP